MRKHLGYSQIPGRDAAPVNDFTLNVLSPYLNFHRPSFFPEETISPNGRITKRYRYEHLMTPYEKLKSLAHAETFLKPSITFQELDEIALKQSDNEAARRLIPGAQRTLSIHQLIPESRRLTRSISPSFRLISALERTSPAPPKPEDRLQEIAFILAHGLLRLRLSAQQEKPLENPVWPMSPAESDAASIDADMHLALHLAERFLV